MTVKDNIQGKILLFILLLCSIISNFILLFSETIFYKNISDLYSVQATNDIKVGPLILPISCKLYLGTLTVF